MDTNALYAFLAVAETGSFSAAADRLFLTQPAISKRIAALEQELSARLFDRLGRQVLPTEAGRALLPRARHIVQELTDSRRLIANLSEQVGGVLQMATSHHIGLHHLPGVLREFSSRYPQVELDIRFSGSEAACDAVLNGELELAVVTLPDAAADKLERAPLWQDPMAIMVAADHALQRARDFPQALAHYPAILPEAGTFTRRIIEEPLRARGIQLRLGLQTNYLETIRMLVAAGLGWSVLPLTMHTAELHIIELSKTRFMRTLGVVTHTGRTLSRAAQAFRELLHQV